MTASLIKTFATLLVFFQFVFWSCGPDQPSPVPDKKSGPASLPCVDTLCVAFYNVENLFDLHYDGNEYPEYRPGALGWNKETQGKKLANIASVIASLQADVIGLCEVENENALVALQKELKRQGVPYQWRAIAHLPPRTSTAPCLLSKLPISTIAHLGGDIEGGGKRSILEADVDWCGRTLKVFVNHWPSKKHKESGRVAVAQALRERLQSLPPGTEYLIAGDLNTDFDQWSTLRTEKLDDTRGMVGLNHVLGTVVGAPGHFVSYVTVHDLCGNSRPLVHYNPWLEVPENERWSYRYRGAPHTLDHLLFPSTLFDTTGISYCSGSFGPYTWDGKLVEGGMPFRWQMKGYGKRRFHVGEGYSDHLPVRAHLVRAPSGCARETVPQNTAATGVAQGGFEQSLDGWLACGPFTAQRDSTTRASGRFCMRISGGAQSKNGCAARVITGLATVNASRSVTVTFAVQGEGKLSVRLRSGTGKWRYYNGPLFAPSNSARYLQVNVPRWKRVSLPFVLDTPGSADLEIELRAGKEAPFDFRIDDVDVTMR